MVSDRELQVWQNRNALIIQSRYCDDPPFTLDQEKALHEIARSFLIVNQVLCGVFSARSSCRSMT